MGLQTNDALMTYWYAEADKFLQFGIVVLDWHIPTVLHELDPLTGRDRGGRGWANDV
jgi:hypothetical protein